MVRELERVRLRRERGKYQAYSLNFKHIQPQLTCKFASTDSNCSKCTGCLPSSWFWAPVILLPWSLSRVLYSLRVCWSKFLRFRKTIRVPKSTILAFKRGHLDHTYKRVSCTVKREQDNYRERVCAWEGEGKKGLCILYFSVLPNGFVTLILKPTTKLLKGSHLPPSKECATSFTLHGNAFSTN